MKSLHSLVTSMKNTGINITNVTEYDVWSIFTKNAILSLDSKLDLFDADDIKSKGTSAIFQRLKRDQELQPLVDKVSEFLNKSSIDELEPLENAITSKVDSIARKWKIVSRPAPQPKKAEVEDSGNIAKKWKMGNGYVASKKQPNEGLIKNISSKFKLPE